MSNACNVGKCELQLLNCLKENVLFSSCTKNNTLFIMTYFISYLSEGANLFFMTG